MECIPGLEKNIVSLKVYIPARIKDDLQKLADRVRIPLSQFTRELLVSHFFGHTFHPEKLKTWTDDQESIGVEWEQGVRESDNGSYCNKKDAEENGAGVVLEVQGRWYEM